MNDCNLTPITLSEECRILKYSSENIKKGLELARKILNVKTTVISAGESDKNIRYSSEKIWKCVGTIFDKSPDTFQHVSVSPDGQIFAIFSEDRLGIEIWNIKSKVLIKTITCYTPSCLGTYSIFEITSDSKSIVVLEHHVINTRSLESGELLSSLECEPDYNDSEGSYYLSRLNESVKKAVLTNSELFDYLYVAISPSLNLMASRCKNKISIWNLKTGNLLHVLASENCDNFSNLCFANDSPTLIIINDNQNNHSNLEIWNPIDGVLLNTLDIADRMLYTGVAVSYDGSLLMAMLQFYDLRSGQTINNFDDEQEFHLIDLPSFYPGSSSFSRDGKTLVTVNGDDLDTKDGVIKIFKQLSIDEILVTEHEDREIREKLVHKLIVLANRQCTSHDYQKAIESYTTALKIDPNNSEAYNRRSTARSAIGDYQGAMEDLQQVRMI
jgi:WD40 repeat protein